jgi:hypothetical protein
VSRWQVYDERGGAWLGYVVAPDRDSAAAAAVGKFEDAMLDIVYVRRIADVPRNIPIDPAKVRQFFDAASPTKKPGAALSTNDSDDIEFVPIGDDIGPVPIGDEEWRDGPRDDGSYESDEILPNTD